VNVQMRCDPIAEVSADCTGRAKYQLLLECNNIDGTIDMGCKYEAEVGTSVSKTNSASTQKRNSITMSLGGSLEASLGSVSGKVSGDATWNNEFGSGQKDTTGSFSTNLRTTMIDMTTPANGIRRLWQVTGYCGDLEIRSPNFLVLERLGDPPRPIPSSGFVCDKPFYRADENGTRELERRTGKKVVKEL